SVRAPARAMVKVVSIRGDEIEADYLGGHATVPITATDLPVRAEAALASSQAGAGAAKRGPQTGEGMPGERPETESIQEATAEQIRNGLGAMSTHSATTFRVFAPDAKALSVVLYDAATGNEGRTIGPMKRQLNGLWDVN